MSPPTAPTIRFKVTPRVAGFIGPTATRDAQLAAARGEAALDAAELLTVLGALCASADGEVRQTALGTLRCLPTARLLPACDDPSMHPRLLELLVRVRPADSALLARVASHPAASEDLRCRLRQLAGCHDGSQPAPQAAAADIGEAPPETFPEAVDGSPEELGEVSAEALEARLHDAAQRGLTKYQLILELTMAERIKLALTGDGEWRKLLLKDPNRVVHGAVLKNARITEAEVVMVARNRSASDEMIRLILLNREWMKNYEIRRALVVHPKTPLPKALRCVGDLTLRDLKDLMRNRNVSSVIAGTARREYERRSKRGG